MRTIHTILGGVAAIVTNIMFNLTAAAIQQQLFFDQYNRSALIILLIMTIAGSIAGWFFTKTGNNIAPNSKTSITLSKVKAGNDVGIYTNANDTTIDVQEIEAENIKIKS